MTTGWGERNVEEHFMNALCANAFRRQRGRNAAGESIIPGQSFGRGGQRTLVLMAETPGLLDTRQFILLTSLYLKARAGPEFIRFYHDVSPAGRSQEAAVCRGGNGRSIT